MKKDIFRIQQGKEGRARRIIARPYAKYDLSEEWDVGKAKTLSQFYLNIKKVNFLTYLILAVFLVFFVRLFNLQIVSGDKYSKQSEINRTRIQVLEAPRGLFFDRDGNQLVKNKPIFYLAYLPSDFSSTDEIIKKLKIISNLLSIDENDLLDIVSKNPKISYQPLPLLDALSYEEVIKLKTGLKDWRGLELGIRGAREYLFNDYLSHILGYLGKISQEEIKKEDYKDYRLTDFVGRSGLEMQYEKLLRGKFGKKEVEIDARGKVQKVIEEISPVSGHDIFLTIDINIQKKLFDLLKEQLEKAELTKGAAIAIDPRNGDILAAVSFPSFDNNIFSGKLSLDKYQSLIKNPDLPLFFRPLLGEYPSGSIFKPLVALAALEKGLITPSTTILSQGGVRIKQWFFPDWKSGGHGLTNLTKAIAESVNTYFYAIGGGYGDIKGLGIDNITNFARQLFFTKKMGVDYPSEAKGFLPSKEWKEQVKKEKWYIGDTYNVSIGQGDVLITPLQITNFMAYLANGGVMYRPHFLKSIKTDNGEIIVKKPEVLVDNLAQQQNIAAVREGLRATVDWGSARSLRFLYPFVVAGKTGTAQVGGDKQPHAWFTSFAPYNNPTISLTILLENGVGGSQNAVPVAREFYRWYKENYYDNKNNVSKDSALDTF